MGERGSGTRRGARQDARPSRAQPGYNQSVEMEPLEHWRRSLAEWAIPEAILARAPEPPWTLPPDLFARRADEQILRRASISLQRAGEALRPSGTLLDVGAGAGAASLPLAEWATEFVAVDGDSTMLDRIRPRADALGRPLRSIEGEWPAVAEQAPVCDVVVCSHVLYNVPDLRPFVGALSDHARRRVVLEITAKHPAGAINPLWARFHGLRRPNQPTWEDAVAALSALGVHATVEHEVQTLGRPQPGSFDDLVAWTRRRLCLTADRDGEVAAALAEIGVDRDRPETWSLRPSELVVLWWDRGAPPARAHP